MQKVSGAAVEAAAKGVSDEARRRYFGIRADVLSKVEPWECYNVVDALAQQEAGTIFHILMQVTPTIKVPKHVAAVEKATLVDEFGEKRYRGELIPSPPSPARATRSELALMSGTPAIETALAKVAADQPKPLAPEFVMLRVWMTLDGKYRLEGMIKGATADTLRPIEKNEFVGCVLRGRPG